MQYVAWDSDHQRVITKHNDEAPAHHTRDPEMEITFASVDPRTKRAVWEETMTLKANFVLIDWVPEPVFPGQSSGPRVGHFAVASGGSRGGTAFPQDSWLTFPHPVIDLHTGKFSEHWFSSDEDQGPDEFEFPCTPDPYGDVGFCSPYTTEGARQLFTFDEELRLTQRHRPGELRTVGYTEAGDYFLVGASFDYDSQMGQRERPETFKVFFVHRTEHTLHEVEVPGKWYPNPKGMASWGEFEEEMDLVALDGGVLWNSGQDREWLLITPDGPGETITVPDGVHLVGAAPGSKLASPSEFLEAWNDWQAKDFAPKLDDQATDLVISTNAQPMLVELTEKKVSWSAMGEAPSGTGETYGSTDIRGKFTLPMVGANSRWIRVGSMIIDTSNGRHRNELFRMRFLEHVDGLDIFSSSASGLNNPFDDMGTVIAIENPEE